MNNQNNSSAPSGDLHAAIMNLVCNPDGEWPGGEQHAYKLGHRDARHAAAELVAAAEGIQPLADRVQGGLTDAEASAVVEQARLATDTHCDGLPQEPSKEYSDAYFLRTILSRQSMMGGEVRGEIDERIAFEKFMSKRGWAAVYAGDGQYESPSVQDQWEAWKARAETVPPQDQAERAGVPGKFKCMPLRATKEMLHAGMRYFHDKSNPASKANEIYTAMLAAAPSCPITPANAAAANGDGLAQLAIGYESGFFASAPDDLGGSFTLHYESPQEAEAAYLVVTEFIEANIRRKASAADADGQKGGQND